MTLAVHWVLPSVVCDCLEADPSFPVSKHRRLHCGGWRNGPRPSGMDVARYRGWHCCTPSYVKCGCCCICGIWEHAEWLCVQWGGGASVWWTCPPPFSRPSLRKLAPHPGARELQKIRRDQESSLGLACRGEESVSLRRGGINNRHQRHTPPTRHPRHRCCTLRGGAQRTTSTLHLTLAPRTTSLTNRRRGACSAEDSVCPQAPAVARCVRRRRRIYRRSLLQFQPFRRR